MSIQDVLIIGMEINSEGSQMCYYDISEDEVVPLCHDGKFIFASCCDLNNPDYNNIKNHLTELTEFVKNKFQLIRKVSFCITVDVYRKDVLDMVMCAFKETVYGNNLVRVIGREESFAYFAFSQKKDTYANGVMLLEYNQRGISSTYMMQVSVNGMDIIPQESKKVTSEKIESLINDRLDFEVVQDAVIEGIDSIINGRRISSIYLFGEGFCDRELTDKFTRYICNSRRVFIGKNIFAKGACEYLKDYFRIKDNKKNEGNYNSIFAGKMLACTNIITKGIELDICERGEDKRLIVVRPGTNWYNAYSKYEFIIDTPDSLDIIIKSCIHKEEQRVQIDLSQIPMRSTNMTRLEVQFRFENDEGFEVIITDLGFGEFAKASGVVITEKIRF